MKKILIAVDGTEGSLAILSVLRNQVRKPENYLLLHVQGPLGGSMMGAMLGMAEMSTLKESLEGTPRRESLRAESQKILSYYRRKLADYGLAEGRCVVASGHPVEEILKVARQEKVDLIILGSNRKSLLDRLIRGSTSREVEKKAGIPVLIAKPHIAGGREGWESTLDFWEAYALRREKLKMGF